jgi:hypothetical protein
VKGILADVNIKGHVEYLTALMKAEPWKEFWDDLGIERATFDELGLQHDATDAAVWEVCQNREYVLITRNRNRDGPDSLEATIQAHNTAESLPVLTIADTERLLHSREYAERVVESLLDVLMRIDGLRGTGRLMCPERILRSHD